MFLFLSGHSPAHGQRPTCSSFTPAAAQRNPSCVRASGGDSFENCPLGTSAMDIWLVVPTLPLWKYCAYMVSIWIIYEYCWCYTYHSEKYEFVNCDVISFQYMGKWKIFQTTSQYIVGHLLNSMVLVVLVYSSIQYIYIYTVYVYIDMQLYPLWIVIGILVGQELDPIPG